MPKPDVVYKVELNDDEILKSLRGISKALEKVAKRGDTAFSGIGKSAKLSGVKIGVISGLVSSLTTEFIQLGKQAIGALVGIARGSVDVASEFELVEAAFVGIFKGNEKAASAVFDRLRAKSRELGTDVTGIAKAFLPFVESLEQVEEVSEQAVALLRSQPESIRGAARIALIEALSGDLNSLQMRFELADESVRRIDNSMKEFGSATGLVEGLTKELDLMGISLESTKDTFATSFGRAEQVAKDLQASLGDPIIEKLKEQFDALGGVLNERSDDFELIAAAFGDVAASVVDFIGSGITEFFENLDTEEAIELSEALFSMVEAAKILAETLLDLEVPITLLGTVNTLEQTILGMAKTLAVLRAQAAKDEARQRESDALTSQQTTFDEFSSVPRDLVGDQLRVDQAGQEAYNEVIGEFNEKIKESSKRVAENKKKHEERALAVGESTESGIAEADALIAEAAAAREAGDELNELEKATKKVNEATEKLETAHQRRILDDQIKFERARLDAAETAAKKRLEIARENQREIEELIRKHQQALADASKDLDRDLSDIDKNTGRDETDLARTLAQDKVDIERDHLQRIQEIRRDFDLSAADAARSRDAIAFVNAQRQREEELQGAETDRSQSLEELRIEGERQKEELKLQREREREDAKEASERQIEDLVEALARAFEEQQRANQEALEDAARVAEEKREAIKAQETRAAEDEKKRNARAKADLEKQLNDEVALIEASEKKKQAAVEASVNAQIKAYERLARARARAAGGGGSAGPTLFPGLSPGFADGGIMPGPTGIHSPAMVAGGEVLFQPGATQQPAVQQAINNQATSINNSRGDINITTGDPLRSAIDREMFINLIREALEK